MDRRDFMKAGMVSTAAGLVVPQAVMAESQDLLASPLAGGVFYTKDKPGRWAAKAPGHVPVVKSSGSLVMVTTPHEMNGYTHYIVKHLLLDAKMNVLGEHEFDPKNDTAPVSEFKVDGYKGPAYALSMCNKHDLWVTVFTL